jgi:hypothetical protein
MKECAMLAMAISVALATTPTIDTMRAPKPEFDSKACLAPWIAGVEDLAKKTGEPLVGMYLDVLRWSPVVHTVRGTNLELSVKIRPEEMPAGDRPYVFLQALCGGEEERVFVEDDAPSSPATYYVEHNLMQVRSLVPADPTVRSLVLLHQMLFANISYSKPELPLAERLMTAYEFEFHLLDKLNPPGYRAFMEDEVERKRQAVLAGEYYEVNLEHPAIERIFPGTRGSTLSRHHAATLLWLRVEFMALQTYEPERHKELRLELIKKLHAIP